MQGGRSGLRGLARASMMTMWGTGLVMPLVMGGGCQIGGSSTQGKENDRLRDEVQKLTAQVDQLTKEREDLAGKLAEVGRVGGVAGVGSGGNQGSMTAQVMEAMPRVQKLEIDSLSGLRPTLSSRPGSAAESVVVYVVPRDGRGRFVQVAGELRVRVRVMRGSGGSGGGAEIARVERTLNPLEVRDAYRSGIMGTHYEVEMKFDAPVKREGNERHEIQAEFVDGLTGREVKVELVKG